MDANQKVYSDAEAVARQKQAENDAQFVVDNDKTRQRKLAADTLGKVVFDIIDFHDNYGDDLLIWVYVEAGTRDLRPSQKVIAMVLWPSPTCHPKFAQPEGSACRKLGVRFEELTFNQGSLFDDQNRNFIKTLQAGQYEY